MQYKTSDIILAACLKNKGFVLSKIELQGSKGIFVFNQVDTSVIYEYDLGKMLVEPVSFNNTIKQLTTSVRRMLSKPDTR